MPIINCPECSKEISDAAPSCPNCGFPLHQQQPDKFKVESTSVAATNEKSVGILLGIGILFIPYIFSWLTLRKGYSNTTRAISFVWLVAVVIMINTDSNTLSSTGSTNAASANFWINGNYVDEFKNKTGESYTKNQKRIIGQFSNTATENSSLGVDLLINKNSVDVKLYEYNRDVPVKSSLEKMYYIFFMHNDNKYTHTGKLQIDRIEFKGEAFAGIIKALESNSEIKFNIIEATNTTSSYFFTVPPNTQIKSIKK